MNTIIKRDGSEQVFDSEKIIKAVEAAFRDVENEISTSAHKLAESIAGIISQMKDKMTVEEIQDNVEELLMASHRKDVARAYIRFRYKRELVRHENTTDKDLIELINGDSEYWNDENSNKNAKVSHTMRDYIAGITSTDLSRRLIIPEDVVKAHDEGIIHFHDLDYAIQPIHNCCLLNAEDMLQNGTVINGVKIDKPHSLRVASTCITQFCALASSSQYGGLTISLAHLAPFVEESRKRYRQRFEKIITDKKQLDELVEEETHKEIVDSMQLIQYQTNSLNSSNGQAPFLSVCMWLGEVEDEHTKDDLALLIEEMLNQRYKGFKNEKDAWVGPAFPKLLYFLEEDNITPDSKYWYLTQLAAKVSAKRLTPDYISTKVMKKLKNGNIYPCMGAVEGKSVIKYRFNNEEVETTFEQFWLSMLNYYEPLNQPGRVLDLYLDTSDGRLEIWDTMFKWVKVKKLTRCLNDWWVSITFRWHFEDQEDKYFTIRTTTDHPFPVKDENSVWESPNGNYGGHGYRRTKAEDLKISDHIYSAIGPLSIKSISQEIENKQTYAYDVETESDTFEVNGLWSHNCRSFLTPSRFTENYAHALNFEKQLKSKSGITWGRFNQGVVTLNLPDVAFSAIKEFNEQSSNQKQSLDDIFWRILRERCDLVHKALRCKHERLCKATSDVAPVMWQHGGLARLKKHESIKELLYHGYSTISFGFIGLYECVKAMTGEDQTGKIGRVFGLQVMKFLNSRCQEWKAAEDVDYSVYSSPMESGCYRAGRSCKRRFGNDVFVKLDGHDRDYLTNSYHIPSFTSINPFEKLTREAEFQELSPGGAISYVEAADLSKNLDVMLQVIKHIYETILYAEINVKSDYCSNCGFDGEIKIIDKDNKLIWQCPNCGCEDKDYLYVSRRTCGYVGTNFWNQGKTQEIRDRYVHLDNHESTDYL